jgi:hypothetical protein
MMTQLGRAHRRETPMFNKKNTCSKHQKSAYVNSVIARKPPARPTANHRENTIARFELVKLKCEAIRHGIWFKALSKVERALLDLAVKIVPRVRSFVLATSLADIAQKLIQSMKNRVQRLTHVVGANLALKLSRFAQAWGNKSAREWAANREFQQYLAITYLNTPTNPTGDIV